MSRYAVRCDGAAVEAWLTARLPFQPTDWRVDLRHELRRALRSLPAGDGVLHAEYAAADDHAVVDLENILLYNVGTSAARHLCPHGLILERVFAEPDAPADSRLPASGLHHHRYALTTGRPIRTWRPGAEIARFARVRSATVSKPGPIWAAIRRQADAPLATVPRDAYRRLDLTLAERRTGRRPAVIERVKPLVDGVISAYHRHAWPDDRVAERLAAAGVGSTSEIAEQLRDPTWDALGRRRLVKPFGARGVQWNPADERCVAIAVTPVPSTPDPAGPRWEFSGRLCVAEPTGPAAS